MTSTLNLEAQEAESLSLEGPAVKGPSLWSKIRGQRTTTAEASFHMFSLKRKAGETLNHSELADNLRLEAIQLLYGLDSTHVKAWPGISVVCNYWEKVFEGLLHRDFDVTWKILQREKPQEARGVWHWCLRVLRALQTLQADENISLDNIYRELTREHRITVSVFEKDRALLAIFTVVCWSTMTLDPDLQLEAAHNESIPASRELALRAIETSMADEPISIALGQAARRPIKKVFRGLRMGELEGDDRPGTVTSADTIYESSVNAFSLYRIGRVRLTWVGDLASHLAFDRQSRTLSVFCLPSFCVASILRTQEIKPLQHASAELLRPKHHHITGSNHDASSLYREVLLTYRLLFGQSSYARDLSNDLLDRLEDSSDIIDPFLRTICSTKVTRSPFLRRVIKPSFPTNLLLPPSSLDLYGYPLESDTYSARDDLPYFGARLLVVQRYNLRQQPGRVRDLWRDRRVPLQWYTFWAVLWVGGATVLLGVLQLAATIVQTYYSAPH